MKPSVSRVNASLRRTSRGRRELVALEMPFHPISESGEIPKHDHIRYPPSFFLFIGDWFGDVLVYVYVFLNIIFLPRFRLLFAWYR